MEHSFLMGETSNLLNNKETVSLFKANDASNSYKTQYNNIKVVMKK
jgi:hypothetical protein